MITKNLLKYFPIDVIGIIFEYTKLQFIEINKINGIVAGYTICYNENQLTSFYVDKYSIDIRKLKTFIKDLSENKKAFLDFPLNNYNKHYITCDKTYYHYFSSPYLQVNNHRLYNENINKIQKKQIICEFSNLIKMIENSDK